MLRLLLRNFVIIKNSQLQRVLPSHYKKINFFSTSSIFDNKISAVINSQDRTIDLCSKNDGLKKILKFPFVWLRDNCKCEKCHHKSSSSRILNWEIFDLQVQPKSIKYDEENDILKIVWNDMYGHISEYEYSWLNERNFTDENRKNFLNKFYRPPKNHLTKKNFMENLDCFDLNSVLQNDSDLYNWLYTMITKGVSIITNVPESENEVRVLANRVGFIRRTHYGEEFTVKAKEGTSNVAYLSENLQMHTDLPYYEYAPGVNLLHCLVQSHSKGAQNLFTDGFYIAHMMREHYPEDFEILTKILVNWSDIGHEDNIPFHSIYRAPVICLDYERNITRINHSIPQRDSFFTVSVNDAQQWYVAYGKFINLMHEEAIEMKIQEGTIFCFDNSRLIHGRKKYEDTKQNRRHVIGAYLDWDEIYSRYRVLQQKLNV